MRAALARGMGVSRIFRDTNLFIYLLEGSGDLFLHAQRVVARMATRKDELITSTLTLGEVLAKAAGTGPARYRGPL
jgi:predicted nucleic acid-binding protein